MLGYCMSIPKSSLAVEFQQQLKLVHLQQILTLWAVFQQIYLIQKVQSFLDLHLERQIFKEVAEHRRLKVYLYDHP